MATVHLSEAFVYQHISSEVLSRGEQYYAQRAVRSLVKRENEIDAEVEGSQPFPYHVRITLEGD